MYSIIVMGLHLSDVVVNVGFDQTYIIVCFIHYTPTTAFLTPILILGISWWATDAKIRQLSLG